jgi:hypothetical protein
MSEGMSREAEIGLSDALDSVSGRALIAHMAREGWFMDVVPGVDCLIAQGIAVDLIQQAMYVSPSNTMKLIEEQFIEGGAQNVRRRDSARSNTGSDSDTGSDSE